LAAIADLVRRLRSDFGVTCEYQGTLQTLASKVIVRGEQAKVAQAVARGNKQLQAMVTTSWYLLGSMNSDCFPRHLTRTSTRSKLLPT
jgi:hypothetical protein